MRRRALGPGQAERHEELLPPSRFLGYNRDSLGMHSLSRHWIAEALQQSPQDKDSAYLSARIQQRIQERCQASKDTERSGDEKEL